jgi:hypothetical protein
VNDRDQQDLLSEAFADLPRHRPAAGFKEQVLAELERGERRRSYRTSRWVWATASCLLLASLLVIGFGYQRQLAAERAYRDQVEELRGRYLELLDEVASVRQEAASPDTRLYLGGDERVDLILDWGSDPAFGDMSDDLRDVRPATYEQ